MITVLFYSNALVQKNGASKVSPLLTIIEGTVLYFNMSFRVIFGEFFQTIEGNNNTISLRTIDDIALGTYGNLQGAFDTLILQ